MKIHKSWLDYYKILPFEFSKIVENMKAKFDKGYLRFEIDSAIAKLTVWHNWLNRVRLA